MMKVQEMFKRWQQQNPHPTTELNYHNHFQLLVAVILSAQSTDKMVNLVTQPLFEKIFTPEQMLGLSLNDLTQQLNRLGLHQQKARFILAMCQRLIDDYQGQIPADRVALESLPGVGRKTANVVLNTAFGHPVVAVDTHIFRVAHRLGLSQGKNPLQVELDLERKIPQVYLQNAHHWLILHGRYICQARKPKCHGCLVKDLCEYPQKNSQ